MQDEPDRDLLRRFAHGDREAFDALFRQFVREVYRWILRIVREPRRYGFRLTRAGIQV